MFPITVHPHAGGELSLLFILLKRKSHAVILLMLRIFYCNIINIKYIFMLIKCHYVDSNTIRYITH